MYYTWLADELPLILSILFLYLLYARRFFILHDLMADYLPHYADTQQASKYDVREWHQQLIDGYYQQCDGRWYSQLNDGYFYQYFVYHLIQAWNNQILMKVMTDFNWMTVKLRNLKLLQLRKDLLDAIAYLSETNDHVS